MEVKEELQVAEKTIPVFTVLKNGAILKNIFVVNSRDFSSPEKNDDDGEEILVVGRHPDCHIQLTHPSISRSHLEIRTIPSRQKLFVTDLSSVHGTWVTDQKVEAGACVEVKEGDVIRIGGSTRIYRLHWIPLSRAYDIDNPFVPPLDESTAMEQEEEIRTLEEEIAHESLAKTVSCDDDDDLHLDVTSEGTGSSVPSEVEDTYIRTEEMSPVSLALDNHSVQTQKGQFNEDLQTSTMWEDLDVVEAAAVKPISSYSPSKQQSGGFSEVLGCYELESSAQADACDVRVDLHRNIMSERMESAVPNVDEDPYLAAKEASSLPLPRDSIVTENRQLREDVQNSQELAIDILEANVENLSSCCFPSKGQIDGCIEAFSLAFELAAEVETLSTEFVTKQVTKDVTHSHEGEGETEVSRQVIAVSPNSFPQTEATLEILTEDVGGLGSELQSEVALETDSENPQNEPTLEILTEDVGGLGSELQSEVALVTDSENQKSNGETNVGSRQASAVSDCLFAGNECLSRLNTEDIQSLCSSWQPLPETEAKAPSEIWNEGNPARDQILKSGMTGETEIKFDEGSSSYLSEDLKESGTQSFLLTPKKEPKTDRSIGSGISEDSYSLSEIEGRGVSAMESPMPSTLAAETYEDTESIEELPSDDTGSQENQTPQKPVRDDVLVEIDSATSSSRTMSTCNIWSRRGKDTSVLQLRTNKSDGKQKQIGKQPKGQLQRKQALSDKSISLTVHHGGEILEPEIFTPDKENLTPSSHMLKRLQDIGDIKDSKCKSSSKLSGRPSSSKNPSIIDLVASEAFTEPEIFTPDKENLTPHSHMLKRLREIGEIKETKGSSSSKAIRKPFFDVHLEENVKEEQKPDLNCMISESKAKHEAVALKNKVERAPFQPLLEKSKSQSQSYIEASSTASARNNNSRGIRSSSLLSDDKSKIKWTIVLDTSTLLDKDSRKPLHLLQGLKGTHLVVPRTVLRELNETKRPRSLPFRRTPEIASSALDWIEDCMVNTKWWIQLQSLSEETKATAPTPPVTPQSNGSPAFSFSLHWNSSNAPEIDSPTSQDQVLECALLYRNINSHEKLVLISNDETLKIKAMAEGVICETAHEFYESLVNPFSERFMWRESTVRGRTWSHLDDVVLRERYNNRTCFPYRKKSTFNNGVRGESAAAAKGLKLILLHKSHYVHYSSMIHPKSIVVSSFQVSPNQ